MTIIEELREEIKAGRVILFAGAGLTRNIGAPVFYGLISKAGEGLGYDERIFHGFSNSYMTLAEFYKIEKMGTIEDLCKQMNKEWHSKNISFDKDKNDIYKKIVELNFPVIYTTNYDDWIERAYDKYGKKYHKIITVSDMKDINSKETQIIKFHGDFDNIQSIVFTESSYFDRMSFESPLDIKFRSDIIGKSLMFIGYSMEDINLRMLIYKLKKIWDKDSDKQPKSYIFMTNPNIVHETVFKNWRVTPIVSEEDNPSEGLNKFLQSLM